MQKEPCKQGESIKKGQAIRLYHPNTRKWLHSHLIKSPITQQQEVSAYGAPSQSDGGDLWTVTWDSSAPTWDSASKVRPVPPSTLCFPVALSASLPHSVLPSGTLCFALRARFWLLHEPRAPLRRRCKCWAARWQRDTSTGTVSGCLLSTCTRSPPGVLQAQRDVQVALHVQEPVPTADRRATRGGVCQPQRLGRRLEGCGRCLLPSSWRRSERAGQQ